MYKVDYYTLGIGKVERKVGNIKQSKDTLYTDLPLGEIETELIKELDKKNYFPVIETVEKLKGHMIKKGFENEK